jgi:hypothetical protein
MDNENTVSTTALVGLQGQLNTVQSEIFTTNINLQNIGRLIQSNSNEDQKRLIEEREQERILLERKVREGQENAIQQKISSSLLPPVVKLEKKVNSTFSNITAALSALFGIFGTKIIGGIQSSIKLGLGALRGIGGAFKNALGFITSTLSTLGKGFTSIISSIGGIAGKVTGVLGSLLKSPFKAIADLVGKLLPGIRGGAAAGGAAAGGAAVSSGGFNLFGLKSLGRIFSGAGAIQSAAEGNPVGASIYGMAAFFPNPVTATAALAYSAAGMLNLKPDEKISKVGEKIQKFDFNQINPLNESFNPESTFLNMSKGIQGFFSGTPLPDTKTSETPIKPIASPTAIPIKIESYDSNKINSLPSQKPVPGALPEVKPNLVYLKSEKDQSITVNSGNEKKLTDVPLISSSNSDNFYAVYAQLNYNVVL